MTATDFSNIKYIFFDVDGVLSAPKFDEYSITGIHKFVNGFSDEDWFKSCIISEDNYKYCIAPQFMKEFVQICEGKKIFALTADNNSYSYYSKVDFIRREYPQFTDIRNIFFVPTPESKILFMKYFAEREHIPFSSIMIVEDTYDTVIRAELEGFHGLLVCQVPDLCKEIQYLLEKDNKER